jgi:hypothetical protein
LNRVAGLTVASVLAVATLVATPLSASADETASVSGRIVAPDYAEPIVTLYDRVDAVEDADVEADGSYRFDDVEPGEYTVAFGDDSGSFLTRFLGGVFADEPTEPGITFFTVAEGQAITGIDGELITAKFAAPIQSAISGTAKVGRTLSLSFGEWAEDPDFEVQWLRDGAVIHDEVDTEYEVRKTDVGHRLSADVVAVADGYESVEFTTASVAVLGAGLTGTKPTVSGVAKVDNVLHAKAKGWKPKAKLRYQWLANGKPIAKATKSSLKLTKKLKGKRISVAVTGSRSGYVLLTKKSAATKRVK